MRAQITFQLNDFVALELDGLKIKFPKAISLTTDFMLNLVAEHATSMENPKLQLLLKKYIIGQIEVFNKQLVDWRSGAILPGG